jgi:hypothetical protein
LGLPVQQDVGTAVAVEVGDRRAEGLRRLGEAHRPGEVDERRRGGEPWLLHPHEQQHQRAGAERSLPFALIGRAPPPADWWRSVGR